MTTLNFYSTFQDGLAKRITKPADGPRAELRAVVGLEARLQPGGAWESADPPIERIIHLSGPGDVERPSENQILRRDPAPNTHGFEANYFPAIEFRDPRLPWRQTADAASKRGLMPWLCLVVFESSEYESVNGTQQAIRVHAQSTLPDPIHLWRWAHVQVTSDSAHGDWNSAMQSLGGEDLMCARLLCTRRLKPNTAYEAFVVPTFKLTWARWLGTDAARSAVKDAKANDFAWDARASSPIDMPFWTSWRFQTSAAGDFESLVKLLKPRTLQGVGLREVDCSRPGFGLRLERRTEDGGYTGTLGREGALVSEDTKWTAWGADDPSGAAPFGTGLVDLLNQAEPDPKLLEWTAAANLVLLDDVSVSRTPYDELSGGQVAILAWRASRPCVARLELRSGAGPTRIVAVPVATSSAEMELGALIPETEYQIVLTLTDETGTVESGEGTLFIPLPRLVPPTYGRWQAGVKRLDSESPSWLNELNRDPRHRMASGAGARVAQRDEEEFVAAAWDQIGEVEQANEARRRGQLGRAIGFEAQARLDRFTPESLFAVLGPLYDQILDTNGPKVQLLSTTLGAVTTMSAHQGRILSRATGSLARRAGGMTLSIQQLTSNHLVSTAAAASYSFMDTSGSLATTDLPGAEFAEDLSSGLEAFAETISPGEALTPLPDLRRLPELVAPHVRPEVEVPRRVSSLFKTSFMSPVDALDPIMAHPRYREPVYKRLDSDVLLPGLEKIPQNSVGLLRVNWRFVEAFLVGLNHQFMGELLWRRYPTDRRGTSFRHFWDRTSSVPLDGEDSTQADDNLADIDAIHSWRASLGDNRTDQAPTVVVVVRGQLLRRYPDTEVYITRPLVGPPKPDEDWTVGAAWPSFRGRLGTDVSFMGFPLTTESLNGSGRYVVFQERVTAARFGLDESGDATAEGANNLSWSHFDVEPGAYLDSGSGTYFGWGTGASSAFRASSTYQRPVRVAVPLSSLRA